MFVFYNVCSIYATPLCIIAIMAEPRSSGKKWSQAQVNSESRKHLAESKRYIVSDLRVKFLSELIHCKKEFDRAVFWKVHICSCVPWRCKQTTNYTFSPPIELCFEKCIFLFVCLANYTFSPPIELCGWTEWRRLWAMLGFAPEQQKATPSYGEEERDFFKNIFRYFHSCNQFKTIKIFGWHWVLPWSSKISPGVMVKKICENLLIRRNVMFSVSFTALNTLEGSHFLLSMHLSYT